MIKSLIIENFQSHLKSELTFSNGINVITGQSNHGKTSILRALGWVVSNRPQGLAFKSSFSDKKDTCKVTLEINNQKIIREKSTTINQYQIGSSLFSTIGNDIPSEVSSAINMSEINIQGQFEKHFLLMDSPGEVGRTINKIVKLDSIDELISNISSKVNSTNKEIDIIKKDVDKLYLDLEKFKDFDNIEKLVNELIDYDTKITNNNNIINSLNHIVTSISETDTIIKNIEHEYAGIEEKINNLEQNWVNYNTNIKIANELDKLIKSISLEGKTISENEDIVKDEEAVQIFETEMTKFISVKDVHFRITNIVNEWESFTDIIKKIEKQIDKEEEEFKKILKEAGMCPLCNSVFK